MPLFVPSLKRHGHLDHSLMTIVSVGSRKLDLEDDFAQGAWGVFAPNLAIYGFDADADACAVANAELAARSINWTEQHFPVALGRTMGEVPLYITADPICSSLYRPNAAYVSRFAGLQTMMSPDFTIDMEVTTLDQACQDQGIEQIDFLKIDVQGADLQVLEGAAHQLAYSILAIRIEVEFSPLYLEQPLFADVDVYLRQRGFTLFDLQGGYGSRANLPIRSTARAGQLLWGDALYLRDLIPAEQNLTFKTPEHLLKLACMADVLDFPDYALELLELLTVSFADRPNYNVANSVIESLAQFPDLIPDGLNSLPVIARIRNYASGQALELLNQ
ncbi:FkbM family methyltransferase [Pantanalinema sp. GBBB05]|uniref:FkbM family methyltransferase n=1 Tax=Pantanalinema sp. GBBB05 TaxID=2604139 RepID=UPI001D78A05B|nr:FkbM family methyltransferase [Pantanalinema sp. GBBB05]